MRHAVGIALIVLFAESAFAATTTAVVPPSLANVDGNGSNQSPFAGASGKHWQAVIAPSAFPALLPGSTIVGVAFRANGTVPVQAQTIQNFDVRMSTTDVALASMSTTFATNRGTDDLLVRTGPLVIESGDYPTGAFPNQWGKVITFTTPFVYRGGNLVIETSSTALPSGFPTDSQSGTVEGRNNYADGPSTATATYAQQWNLIVMQLVFDPSTIPVVSTAGLIAMAIALFLIGWAALPRN